MKLRPFTRIITEDFKPEEQALVSKLANTLNPSLEQMNRILTKNVDFENLNQEVLVFNITVDSSGTPIGFNTVAHSLKSKPQGLIVINVLSAEPNIYPTGTPFVSFTFGSDYTKIKINNITGLPANKKFSISCLVIG